MKKVDVSRLERLRVRNLKIGYAAALFLVLMAFNWTTERPTLPIIVCGDDFPGEMQIPPTYPDKKVELPPALKTTIENKIIIESELPNLISDNIQLNKPVEPIENDKKIVHKFKRPIISTPPRPKEIENKNKIFKIVEDIPIFGDCYEENMNKEEKKKCSDKALLTYLVSNLRYPAIARENGVEGLVVISFVVEKDGTISKPEIIREIGAGCGQEALRVVKNMPDWIPGKQRGREVRVQYNLPVKFKLN